jgi:hypothetical protein
MEPTIVDQVVDFYYVLFDRIFSEPIRPRIAERLKRDAVIRQVEDAAGAASQSLTRFFLNRQLSEQQVADILDGFTTLRNLLKLDDIANPNETPEGIADVLIADMP